MLQLLALKKAERLGHSRIRLTKSPGAKKAIAKSVPRT